MTETSKVLRDHAIFGKLSDAARQKLEDAANVRRFKAGETLIREGEFNHALMLVLAGQVQVENTEGEIVVRLGPDNVLGEISTSGMSLPVASVVAVDAVEVLAFPIELVSEIAFEEEAFAEALRELGMRRAQDL